jgi:hypothetical protein
MTSLVLSKIDELIEYCLMTLLSGRFLDGIDTPWGISPNAVPSSTVEVPLGTQTNAGQLDHDNGPVKHQLEKMLSLASWNFPSE